MTVLKKVLLKQAIQKISPMIQLTSASLQEKMYCVVPRAKHASGKLLVQNL